MVHRKTQNRRVDPFKHANQQRLGLFDVLGQKQTRQHGHQCQRKNHRTGERHDDGKRHRAKQFSFDALKRQDWQVDNHDDQLAKHRRFANFHRRLANDFKATLAVLVVCQVTHTVLDHHDRTIDDQAEVDRPQTQQAGGDSELQHAREGEQHRQRNRQGNNQPSSQIAQENEQHRDNQQAALE